ncbi:MAG: DMT family transporter [Rhodospirillales bacterium]|nr:DMT family transporter [Rhodospirillales bacterium]
MSNKREFTAYLLLGAVVLLWGVNWPIMKIGLAYISPMWFALARVFLGGACIFAILAWQGRLHLPARRDLPIVITVGVLQIAVLLALLHTGVRYVDAGRSAVLSYTTPLWIGPLALVFLRERLSGRKLAGLALGLAGIAFLFDPTVFNFSDTTGLMGNAILILAAIVLAVVIVHVRAHPWPISALELLPWQMALGAMLLLPVTFMMEGPPKVVFSPALAAVLVYNGPVASAFCLWAYLTVMRNLPAMSTAMGSLGVPAVGIFFSVLLMGEPLPASKIAGLALIAMGVLVVTLVDLGKPREPALPEKQ